MVATKAQKDWYQRNKERLVEVHRDYHKNHLKEIKETKKIYRESHKEEEKNRFYKYKKTHKEDLKTYKVEYSKQYRKDNKEKIRIATHKRQRSLGYETPINKRFDGSEGHHLNKTEVVFITKGLHRSIAHNVFTGEGMAEINHLALLEVFGGEC